MLLYYFEGFKIYIYILHVSLIVLVEYLADPTQPDSLQHWQQVGWFNCFVWPVTKESFMFGSCHHDARFWVTRFVWQYCVICKTTLLLLQVSRGLSTQYFAEWLCEVCQRIQIIFDRRNQRRIQDKSIAPVMGRGENDGIVWTWRENNWWRHHHSGNNKNSKCL